MNHICLNTILIKSFDVAFLILSSGISFRSAMTKCVVVISVERRLLQKFCNVIFSGPLCFMTLISAFNPMIVVKDWEICTT